MKISAFVHNSISRHRAGVVSDAAAKSIPISAKANGRGSEINGGELLMLALATCYCNDLFREAGRRGIAIDDVEVTASADFPGVGLSARNIRYSVRVKSGVPKNEIEELLVATDQVAEIHNTVRSGAPVVLDARRSGPAETPLSDQCAGVQGA